MSIPLLLVSDAPNLPSGLARITRDLAHHICARIPEFEVAQLGWDFDDHYRSQWPVHRIRDTDNWGRADLPEVWWKCFGKRRGVVLSVWDPARCFSLLEDAADVPAQLWGYFPLDGVNIHGSLGGPAAAAVRRYRRVLGYGEFGAEILGGIVGRAGTQWLPHGLDLAVFHPRRAPEGLVGVVATNTPRKDWALAFQTFSKMREAMPKLRLWCHISKEVTQSWSIPELADQCGLGGNELIVTGCERDGMSGELPDDTMANMYSACLVTLGIGLGEGWGYPLCFKAGTFVETLRGPKAIENVLEGDLVLTHKGQFRPVKTVFKRMHRGRVKIVEPAYTEPIHCTYEHPFYVPEKGWVEAGDLSIHDQLAVPLGTVVMDVEHLDMQAELSKMEHDETHVWRRNGYSGKTGKLVKAQRRVPVDVGFCRLLGLFVAEGYTGSNGQFAWCFHSKEEDYLRFVESEVSRLFGLEMKRKYKSNYPGVEVLGCFTAIAEWLGDVCGTGARNKKVPDFIFTLPEPKIRQFLAGLFQGDGSGLGTGLNLTTSSPLLAEGVRILFRRLGYICAVKHRQRKWKGCWRNESVVNLHGDSARELAKEFGMRFNDFRVSTRRTPPKWSMSENFIEIPISELSYRPFQGWVYNLEVEEDNSYTANGVAVHNCESLACGRPVVHCDYAGGAALVPRAEWRVKERIMHVESAYALKRPIIDPSDFADAALSAADWVMREEAVASAFCAGSVRNLGWDVLWPRWEAWFRQGLRELE